MVDEPPPGLDDGRRRWPSSTMRGLSASSLATASGFGSWLFKHDIVEACTAVKGQMLVELLEARASPR